MGRHWERQDAGYSCYSGFLHMEAMHTNPIIICFCSILYYKDLSEHLRRYRKQRRMLASNREFAGDVKVLMNEFTGRLSEDDVGLAATHPNGGGTSNGGFEDSISARKQLIRREYKTQVVIRWHLFAIMSMNKDLIKYRKIKEVKKRDKREKEGVFGKIKKRVQTLCSRQKEECQVSSL